MKIFGFGCAVLLSVQVSFASELEQTMAGVESMNKRFVKIVALLAKRDDITRARFKEHYENNHVPLAKGVFEGWPGYIRNHIDKVYSPQPLNFDVLTMFWYRDSKHLHSTVELLNGEAGKVIRADEHEFMSKATNRYYQALESGSGLLSEQRRPWAAGFQDLTKQASKVVALIPSEAADKWLEVVESFSAGLKPQSLRSWVNNHVVDKPAGEFEEITELWFSNLTESEAQILKWRSELPGVIFVSVSTFESSIQ